MKNKKYRNEKKMNPVKYLFEIKIQNKSLQKK